ncbi:MAG: Rne/Rng family ribonuclease [Bernardetiaceae bacterium]|nr:Rne/Rng family ribonuclease [Bernardetiaceae bacterium]
MSCELVINANDEGGRIALLQDRKLVEFHYDDSQNSFTVGDIYLGTVRRIVPGLNAAFIDIGYEKDAFLHYLDLGPNIRSLTKYTRAIKSSRRNASYKLSGFPMEPEIDKLGKIGDVLKPNQQILVQVVKEPISTKGPRLSCQLSLAGRYLVLVPFSDKVLVSRKITRKMEKRRLERLLESIKPEHFSVIVRTMAEDKDVAELDRDLSALLDKWKNGVEKLTRAKPNDKIIGEMSRATSILRDMLNETFDSITVDEEETYDAIKGFIHKIAPDKEKIVKLYNGKSKIFEAFGIEKQLKMLFGKTVNLPSGGYIIIEHTEALHVVDVNSGNKSSREDDQESTALKVNIEAASEIGRQLQLRDMGGIIVIDFIDMKKSEHRKQLYAHMKECLKRDRSKHTILPLTKFGLMQITRQRVRPELNIITREKCPTCDGTGKVAATIAISDNIETQLDYILTKQNAPSISLNVHPYLHAFFTAGFPSRRIKWLFKYYKWVTIVKDTSLALNEFNFLNKQGEKIELSV